MHAVLTPDAAGHALHAMQAFKEKAAAAKQQAELEHKAAVARLAETAQVVKAGTTEINRVWPASVPSLTVAPCLSKRCLVLQLACVQSFARCTCFGTQVFEDYNRKRNLAEMEAST